MFCAAEEGKTVIKYLDIRSLYPTVNFTVDYPIGHPSVHIHNRDVHWTTEKDIEFRGIIKCRVEPPKRPTMPPVLPIHINDQRLLFPLCRKCSSEHQIGCFNPEYSCEHSSDERAFVVTTTDMELELALRAGYIVTKLYRSYQFSSYSNDLFKPYVRKFYKIKNESSGWTDKEHIWEGEVGEIPEHIKESRRQFIEHQMNKYQIDMDAEKMVKNAGLRYISKLCLNSLWYFRLIYLNIIFCF